MWGDVKWHIHVFVCILDIGQVTLLWQLLSDLQCCYSVKIISKIWNRAKNLNGPELFNCQTSDYDYGSDVLLFVIHLIHLS